MVKKELQRIIQNKIELQEIYMASARKQGETAKQYWYNAWVAVGTLAMLAYDLGLEYKINERFDSTWENPLYVTTNKGGK